MLSLEDVVEQHDHLCLVPYPSLAFWPDVECIYDDCTCCYKGLHVPWPLVPFTSYESILPPIQAIWGYHPGWCVNSFASLDVPYLWKVRLWYLFDLHILCLVWPFEANVPLRDPIDFRFFLICCELGTTPEVWTRFHPHPMGYPEDVGKLMEESMVTTHREGSRIASSHSEVGGWCEIAHTELGCEHSSFSL